MDVEFKFDGSDFEKALKEYPKDLVTQLRKGSKKSASTVEHSAKQNHRFTTRTGRLVKSIKGYGGVGYESGRVDRVKMGRISDHRLIGSSKDSMASAYVELVLHDEGERLGTKYGKWIHGGFKGWSPDRFIDKGINNNKAQIMVNWELAIDKANRKF